ncbi:MAG: hypothetical protein IPP86_06700 [Bacteroidetes bacterium]|nr:hypothetical protein [Bacteroidota bacterium]
MKLKLRTPILTMLFLGNALKLLILFWVLDIYFEFISTIEAFASFKIIGIRSPDNKNGEKIIVPTQVELTRILRTTCGHFCFFSSIVLSSLAFLQTQTKLYFPMIQKYLICILHPSPYLFTIMLILCAKILLQTRLFEEKNEQVKIKNITIE